MYCKEIKRFIGFVSSLVLFTLMTPGVKTATAAKPVCDPDKRRAARVLTQADVPEGANFSGADLRCGSYIAIRFVNVNLDRAQLDGAEIGGLTNVSADGASFVRARILLGGADRLRGVTITVPSASGSFKNANLSGALLWVRGKIILDGANLSGAEVQLSEPDPGSSYIRTNFSNAKLNVRCIDTCGNFTGAVMKDLRGIQVSFQKSTLIGVDFSGAQLARADFSNADLTGAKFSGAQLQGAKFYGAIVKNTNFKGAKGKVFGVGKSN